MFGKARHREMTGFFTPGPPRAALDGASTKYRTVLLTQGRRGEAICASMVAGLRYGCTIAGI